MVLACMENLYSPIGRFVEPAGGWFSRARFETLVMDLDFTSSPGFPYMRENPTIGGWLKLSDGVPDVQQLDRLWYDVNQVLVGRFDHRFRVFVKDEVHKVSKRDLSRWRLIMASALPVQMVWRMLFSEQNDALNFHCWDTPSKHGTVFCYGGWRRFVANMRTMGVCVFRDLTSWDVTAPGWVFDVILEFRRRLCPDLDASWAVVSSLMYDDAYRNSKLMFSNGMVLQQQYSGTMKSGLYNTITDNSLAMVAMHVLALFRARLPLDIPIWATGDDAAHGLVSDRYYEELNLMGAYVKETSVEPLFMGTEFSGFPKPAYLHKHLVNVACAEGSLGDVLTSYLHLYAHSPWFAVWSAMAMEIGLKCRSRFYYQFWYDSALARLC